MKACHEIYGATWNLLHCVKGEADGCDGPAGGVCQGVRVTTREHGAQGGTTAAAETLRHATSAAGSAALKGKIVPDMQTPSIANTAVIVVTEPADNARNWTETTPAALEPVRGNIRKAKASLACRDAFSQPTDKLRVTTTTFLDLFKPSMLYCLDYLSIFTYCK